MNTELLKSKLLEAAFNGSLTHAETSKWKKTTMGEIFEHHTGKALKKSDKEGVLKPYITTSNVYWNRFELDTVKEMYFKPKELAKYTITKGDLLVCEGGDVGRSAIWDFDYDVCFQNHIHRLRPKKEVCLKFYYYIMLYYKWTNKIQGTGIGLEGFSSGVLDKLKVPYPPLVDQQQIVSTLEEGFSVLGAIANAKENLSITAKMLRSKILQAAFDGTLTGADTSKWKWLPMKRVTTLMCDGDWIEKKDQSDDGIRLVQTGNVGSGHFVDKPNSHKYISEDTFFRLNCTEVFPGDILISRLPSPVGRACELPKVDYRMITAVDCTIVRLNDSISKKLFLYYTQSPTYHNKMGESNFITGTTRARISRSNLEKIPIPLPPLAEQKRIVEKIEELFEQIDKIK